VKVLERKREKLKSLNEKREAECSLARQQLAIKLKAVQTLTSRLESVKKNLKAVEVQSFETSSSCEFKPACLLASMPAFSFHTATSVTTVEECGKAVSVLPMS
jgi:hypothetical protein